MIDLGLALRASGGSWILGPLFLCVLVGCCVKLRRARADFLQDADRRRAMFECRIACFFTLIMFLAAIWACAAVLRAACIV